MSGVVCWLTGLPQAGKSTLARRLCEALREQRSCVRLDSDELREALGVHDYGELARDAFYAVLARLAALLAQQGHVVLVAATAPRASHRALARALAPRFVEVWVDAPLSACAARDSKGLYARAEGGDAPNLPGVGAPYEPPAAPDFIAAGGHDDGALARLAEALAR